MKRILILFVLVCFFPGCQKKPVAVINDEEITEKIFNRYMKQRVKEHKAQGVTVSRTALRESVLQQIIVDKLLFQGAKEKNITVTDAEVDREVALARKMLGEKAFMEDLKEDSLSIEEFKNIIREKLAVRKFVESIIPDIPDEEIRDFYKNSPTPFLKPETVHVRFIQTSTEATAKAILKEMEEENIGFDEMAEKLAKEKRAVVSTYGWTRSSFFSPKIAAALKKLKAGTHGGPYKGKDGYYIIRVKQRQEQGVKSLDEARGEIKNILLNRKRQMAVGHWIAKRKQTALIVIN